MIVTKSRGKKKIITSSYFGDIRTLRKSRYETDYGDLKRNSTFDVEQLKKAYLIQEIVLWRKGCIELTEYTHKLSGKQLENIETEYLGEDYIEGDSDDNVRSDKGEGLLSWVTEEKVIASPDG